MSNRYLEEPLRFQRLDFIWNNNLIYVQIRGRKWMGIIKNEVTILGRLFLYDLCQTGGLNPSILSPII